MITLMAILFVCYDLTNYSFLNMKALALNENSLKEPLRLIAYSVMHVDISHLLMNMFTVFVLTPYLFKTHQIKQQILFFILSPVLVGLVCATFFVSENNIGAVGYSGAVFSMIGFMWFKHPPVFIRLSLLSAVYTLWIYITDTPTYHAAHIVGYTNGLFFAVFLKKISKQNIK